MNAKHFTATVMLFAVLLAACAEPTQSPIAGEPQSGTPQVVVQTQVVKQVQTQVVNETPAPPATASGVSAVAYVPPSASMIIKDAEMEIMVRDTDLAITQITQMAADDGGYVLSLQTFYTDGFKYATMRLGVPSVSFEKALTYLHNVGVQVLKEATSGQDVSAEYTDLQSKLTNLEATAARVRDFLKNAQTVEESLRVNGQLSELEGQIEQVKGQMNFYQGRAAVSTITLSLFPQVPPSPTPTPTATPTPAPGWNPGHTFDQASGVLVNVTQNTVDVLIWLIVVLGPMALVVGLLIGGALRLRRLFKR